MLGVSENGENRKNSKKKAMERQQKDGVGNCKEAEQRGASSGSAQPPASGGTAAASAADAAKTNQPPQHMWECDVCHVRKFSDYEEACRHEEECRRQQKTAVAAVVKESPPSSAARQEQEEKEEVEHAVKQQPKKSSAAGAVSKDSSGSTGNTSSESNKKTHPFFFQKQQQQMPAKKQKQKKQHEEKSSNKRRGGGAAAPQPSEAQRKQPFFWKLAPQKSSSSCDNRATSNGAAGAASARTAKTATAAVAAEKERPTGETRTATAKATAETATISGKSKKGQQPKTDDGGGEEATSDDQPPTAARRRSTRQRRPVVDLMMDTSSSTDGADDAEEEEEEDVVVVVDKKSSVGGKGCSKKRSAAKPATKKGQSGKKRAKTTSSSKARGGKKVGASSSSSSAAKTSSSLAPIFAAAGGQLSSMSASAADTRAFLNEQAAAMMRAQRLQKQRENQERNKRRQEMFEKQQQQKASAGDEEAAPAASVASIFPTRPSVRKASSTAQRKQYPPAPRFPVPSHVFPEEAEPLARNAAAEDEATCLLEVKPRSSPLGDQLIECDLDVYPHLLPPSNLDTSAVDDTDPGASRQTVIQRLLRRLLTPKRGGSTQRDSDCSSLLLQLHPDVTRVSGFLQKWMAERTKANDRRDERSRALAGRDKVKRGKGKKKGSSRRYANDDDELWYDTDEEDRSNVIVIPSLCLLTGPVGCGKTNLVHAVSRSQGCNVVELNTSDKRGAAALKKALQEATQSHSSLQLLADNKSSCSNAKNPFFFASKKSHQEDIDLLADTDDEQSPEGSAESGDKLSTLTVILLDEVDNLFESDAGFWPALWEVSQRSKCPIFLTANSAKNIDVRRLTHFAIQRPTPVDCVPIVQHLIKSQGLELAEDKGSEGTKMDEQLAALAELCECDLRQVAQHIQVFSYSSTFLAADPTVERALTSAGSSTGGSTYSKSLPDATRTLSITDVKPSEVRNNEYTLLTITGSGFTKLKGIFAPPELDGLCPVTVRVGDQTCPEARIVSDTAILAVKAPCPPPLVPELPPQGKSSLLNFIKRGPRDSYAAMYKAVSIASSCRKLGLESITPSGVCVEELADGQQVLAMPNPILLDCSFSKAEIHPGDESGEEMEFEDPNPPLNSVTVSSSRGTLAAAPQNPIDTEKVSNMLREGLSALGIGQTSLSAEHINAITQEEDDVLAAATDRCFAASDAALFEDLGSSGCPLLAGASRGFGFNLTEAYPLSTNDNCKPPSEEHLFSHGWKENCYFYGGSDCFLQGPPPSARDRDLMKRLETSLRGCSFQQAEAGDIPLEEEEEDDEDNFVPAELNEEDAFMLNSMPPCLKSLPFLLRRVHGENRALSLNSDIRDELFERNRGKRRVEQLEYLDRYIYPPEDYQKRQFAARGLGRELDPIISREDDTDTDLFLDYLPLLRVMSVHEQASQRVFEAAKENSEEDGHDLSNRSRRTRRATKNGRKHHFVTLSNALEESLERDEGELSARDLGEKLAALSLLTKFKTAK